ncbi:MAG: ParB N-terminal domain-containing protein [Paracoccaceae bacterium]|nr:ParB N-terminal domain-containing protein [Paracoccaceae bacterium]
MARRKRLAFPAEAPPLAAPETKSMTKSVGPYPAPPPIARVAAETAAEAALAEVAGELAAAREEGRIVARLPLETVDVAHIVRDRQRIDPEEMAALEASIAAHGQRTPIEAVETAPGRYGLISGARRLAALKALHRRTGEARFSEVAALLRRPSDAGSAYVAMVEENEIRADLSHWERAEIVARAVEEGVFADIEAGLAALFGAVSRARRSKIRSFVGLRAALGGAVRFGPDLSERLGLALAKAVAGDRSFAPALAARLAAAGPATAEDERAVFAAALKAAETGPGKPGKPAETVSNMAPNGPGEAAGAAAAIRISGRAGQLRLEGPGVDGAFRTALEAFVESWRREAG